MYLSETCETLVSNDDYVNKDDILYRITRKINNEDDNIIEIRSPFSGYVKLHPMKCNDDDIIITFAKSLKDYEYKNTYQVKTFSYSIDIDKISGSKKIVWDDKLFIGGQPRFEFNIKDNLPCMHLRYSGFHINVNDKLYFLDTDNNPILKLVVVKKRHRYDSRTEEVDIILSEDDVQSLMKEGICSTCLRFQNEDAPVKALFNHLDFYQYINAYQRALEEACVSYRGNVQKYFPTGQYDYCYVYLMRDTRNGYHKIGMSNNPEVREKTLQSEVPAVQMVCSKKYPSRKIAKAIEAALHNAYAEQRVRGEWFNLSPLDIQMLKETLS